MTEQEWLACGDAERMLDHLEAEANTWSNRLRRLLRPWNRTNPHRRAYLFSSGLRRQQLATVDLKYVSSGPSWLSEQVADREISVSAIRRSRTCSAGEELARPWQMARDSVHFGKTRDLALEVTVLRDIFGNPFRPVALDPAWLSWNNATVSALAQSIYCDRAFDRIPILADALEDGGCHDPDILGHCRGPGPHVRGCWVVDLLLERA